MGAIVSGYNKLGQKQVAQHLLGQYSDMDVHKTEKNFTLLLKKKKKKKKKKVHVSTRGDIRWDRNHNHTSFDTVMVQLDVTWGPVGPLGPVAKLHCSR
jgi:bisphosphoglycerate-independent phosphoglycerate mutase (AlkP superfamily)